MKTAAVIRHLMFEDLGILAPILMGQGYSIHYYEAGVDDLTLINPNTVDLMVVLGGPIGAFDEEMYPFLITELALISQRLQVKKPLLGICLGAQLMARALGASVGSMGRKEIGYAPLTLTDAGQDSALKYLSSDIHVLHWHGDQFGIPQGCESLAVTDICPHQAFAIEHYALGLQFHLEADSQHLEQWLIGHAAELAQAGIAPQAIRQQAVIYANELKKAGTAVFEHWLAEADNLS
jgi:GMP synthase (glutamine-hydrolysing)